MTRAATATVAAAPSRSAPQPASAVLQRSCACDHKPESSGACGECDTHLQRKALDGGGPGRAPSIVHDVLRSAGQPLDGGTRAFMEPRFAHSFGAVRIHTDAAAAASARAVHAAAYTVGRDIVFDSGRYAPDTAHGRRLLAHELTHVVQQSRTAAVCGPLSIDAPHSASEQEAERTVAALAADSAPNAARAAPAPQFRSNAVISRADPGSPDAATLAMHLGQTPRTGLQFWPTDLTDTKVGPVTVQGGLMNGQANRLNVIIAENMTLRTLAVELLPLWVTATPFTPPGAAAPLPLDIITADELARSLLVYNQYYLQVPAMPKWRAGLRFPLPIEVDAATHVGTLHPLQIRALATAFDPAWEPRLDQRAPATVTPPAATVQADVTAFLASEPTALGRGIALGVRAITNAVAELPFIREAFHQIGAGGFDVALQLMDNLVIREIQLLAAQRDGAAILGVIRTALAAGPAAPSATQQASLTRANAMLASVAGVAAQAPPGATHNSATKTVTIDTIKLDGSNRNPATDVALANSILGQCNVRLAHGINNTATHAETTAWIGADRQMQGGFCNPISAEQRRLSTGANARFGLTARIRAFYIQSLSTGSRAESCIPSGSLALVSRVSWVTNSATGRTLGHEVGHILLNSGAHPAGATNIMSPTNQAPLGETISDAQCTTIYNNA